MKGDAWDKLLLLVVSVAVIGLSGLFVAKAMGFGGIFVIPSTQPNNELPEPDDRADIAKRYVERTAEWTSPVKGENQREVDLFVSIPIVESKGQLIDMGDPDAPLIRPPVENLWLINNNLDFLNSGILNLDSDGDGFTNLEEWEAKTDPNDPGSHPPYANKLQFLSRQQQEYILRFAARPDSERFQITRQPSDRWPGRAENFYLRVGETSDDNQFRVEGFEEKTARNAVGIDVDASVLRINYLPKDEMHELVRNQNTVIPTYFAQLSFPLDSWEEYVKEGDAFNLPRDPETRYRVVKVNEDSVVITYQAGSDPEETVEIKKN